MLGALGTGTGIIIAVTTIAELNDTVHQETGFSIADLMLERFESLILSYVDIHAGT